MTWTPQTAGHPFSGRYGQTERPPKDTALDCLRFSADEEIAAELERSNTWIGVRRRQCGPEGDSSGCRAESRWRYRELSRNTEWCGKSDTLGLPKLHVVRSLHDRKALMAGLSDAFVALAGGFGTLEEFCEVVTGTQLGRHATAPWHAECVGVLLAAAGNARPRGGGAILEAGESGVGAGAGQARRPVASVGAAASDPS